METRAGKSSALSCLSAGEQRHQTARRIQRGGVVEAADVGVANKYLRHGAATAAGDHFVLFRRIEIDTDFFDVGDAAALEQTLGRDAIRANGGALHYNFDHGGSFGDDGLFGDGQVGAFPRDDAARLVVDGFESGFFQHAAGARRALTAAAGD